MTKVSEIQIQLIKPKNGLIGLASCIIDDKWYFGNIGIYTYLGGEEYRVTYPTKVYKNGQSLNIVHPITKEAGEAVRKAISEKVMELLNEPIENYGEILD